VPGPGFSPFWIGVLIAALGALLKPVEMERLRKDGLCCGARGGDFLTGDFVLHANEFGNRKEWANESSSLRSTPMAKN